MTHDPRATWRNPRILLVLVVIFLCGALAGVIVMRFGIEPKVEPPATYWTNGGKQYSLEHFRRELNLNPQQIKEMEAILDDFMLYMHTLQSQMDEVRANGKGRIMLILNPEQQRKFEQMIRETPVQQVH